MDRFKKWAQNEYPLTTRLVGTLAAGIFFVLLLPFLFVSIGPAIDRRFPISLPDLGTWLSIIGICMMIVGVFFALWSIADQLIRASGTPLPMMATQKLLVSGPFRLCRNPMTFGTILMYLGLGISILSPTTLTIVVVLSGLLLVYITRIEEKELGLRFGEDYQAYKARTPFLIPWPFGHD